MADMKKNKFDKSKRNIVAETGEIECFVCENFGKKIVTEEIPLNGQKVLLENVEVEVCQKCGAIYFDGRMINLIAKLLGKKKKADADN
jgi:YgiT-type zinc finger domain-containing protein